MSSAFKRNYIKTKKSYPIGMRQSLAVSCSNTFGLISFPSWPCCILDIDSTLKIQSRQEISAGQNTSLVVDEVHLYQHQQAYQKFLKAFTKLSVGRVEGMSLHTALMFVLSQKCVPDKVYFVTCRGRAV